MLTRMQSLQAVTVVALLSALLLSSSPVTVQGQGEGSQSGVGSSGPAQADDREYPLTISVQEQEFILDRLVPLDRGELERIEDQGRLALYARTETAPFDVLYGLISGRSRDGLARYLPTEVSSPENPCRAEALQLGALTAGDQSYAFAGIETDIPADQLEEIANSEGNPVYADPEADQPTPELFVTDDQGLLRFVLTDGRGLPVSIVNGLPFGDQTYAFTAEVTDTTDLSTLAKAGCTGPFPLFAAADAAQPFETLMIVVSGRVFSYTATGAAPQEATAPADGADETEVTPPVDSSPPPIVDTDATTEPGTGDETQEPATEEATNEPTADPETDMPPTDEATAEPATDEGADENEVPLVIGEDLGDGGQPEGFPREVTVGTGTFTFDRIVSLAANELQPVGREATFSAFARTGQAEPFTAIYLTDGDVNAQMIARYLPDQRETPETACPAEAIQAGTLQTGDTATYVFAGIENDLSAESLEQIGETEGQTVFADPGVAQPSPELFISNENGLLRFVLLTEAGPPAPLSQSVVFGGVEYTFTQDATDQTDVTALLKVGCVGAFPAYEDGEGAPGRLFVVIGGRAFLYESGEAVPEATSEPELPTETATPEATETPAPTETPVPTETPAPTETPVPTETVVPTEAPTETLVPTETVMPTEAPTETLVPTETIVPTEALTETLVPTETVMPTEAPTETPASTETEAPAATAAPTEESAASATPESTGESAATAAPEQNLVKTAEEANLPQTLEVQNTTYVFSRVEVDIDISTLVQVQVVDVEGIELRVFAREEFQGVAPELYCVNESGEVVGRYVVAAASQPTPPAELPQFIETAGNTYVFNEIDIDIDIQTLVQVQVIVVQNVELTVYAEPESAAAPGRLFIVTPNGEVTGQYVESSLVVSLQPLPTARATVQPQPPAVVPTLAPDVPPPAAATADPTRQCAGDPGPANAVDIPAYLPNRIQLSGIAYRFVGTEVSGEAGELTRIGCVGAFEVVSTDQAPRSEVLYLRMNEPNTATQQLFRFEVALTFTVEIEVIGQARVIATGDQPDDRYKLLETWQPVLYSDTSVILFGSDPENERPDLLYAVDVHDNVVGEVIGEYRIPGETVQPSDELVAAAAAVELNPDLTINGQFYILVAIHYPVGTTTNGFVTLFSTDLEGNSDTLLARDKRERELFIYQGESGEPTGG